MVSHYNVQRVVDIYGSVRDRDLGAVGRDLERIVNAQPQVAAARRAALRARAARHHARFLYAACWAGWLFSIVLVYLLIVVNFQSWLDPFIIITALPAALAGIVLFLFLTHTTLSVPALMGAIMCMGVATANSILVVSFAKERLVETGNPVTAALEAGATRFRPVLMTALAMIIGMVPMALGLGEGGEQNAPLGRAVIGGLICATVATLFFVPGVFSLLHRNYKRDSGTGMTRISNRRSHAYEYSRSRYRTTAWLHRAPVSERRRPCLVAVVAGRGGRAARAAGFSRNPGTRARRIGAGAAHRRARDSERSRDPAETGRAGRRTGASGQHGSLHRHSGLCAHQRLPAAGGTSTSGRTCRRGQLLAEIETPEIDQQLRQARAELATAQANSSWRNPRPNAGRTLRKSDSVSQQETDEKLGDLESKSAVVEAAAANVKRLEETQAFQKIYAPFDGVITARNIDIGDLINAGSNGPGKELFHMAAVRQMRVYVQVPQMNSRSATPGTPAELAVPEMPGRRFPGRVVRTSDSMDLASRTLKVEVDVDNPQGLLMPGEFVEVHFKLPAPVNSLTVPVNALLFRAEGMSAAAVRDGRVVLVPVTIGHDYGDSLEVTSGLRPDDRIIVNPPDSHRQRPEGAGGPGGSTAMRRLRLRAAAGAALALLAISDGLQCGPEIPRSGGSRAAGIHRAAAAILHRIEGLEDRHSGATPGRKADGGKCSRMPN